MQTNPSINSSITRYRTPLVLIEFQQEWLARLVAVSEARRRQASPPSRSR